MESGPGIVAFVVKLIPSLNAVYLGSTATFTCDVTAPEPYLIHNYTWVGPESVVRDGRYALEDNRRILKILDVTYEDDNQFVRCNAYLNNGNKGIESFGTLSVLAPGEGRPTTKIATTIPLAEASTASNDVTSKIPTNAVTFISTPQPTDKVTPKITSRTDGFPAVTSRRRTPTTVSNKDTTFLFTENFTNNVTEDTDTESPNVFVPRKPTPGVQRELVPYISAGGAVVAVLGFIVVIIALFMTIRWLRKENEKAMMGKNKIKRGGSSTRALLYNRRAENVSSYDESPGGKRGNTNHVDDDSNSSPGRDNMYTPRNSNGNIKPLKSEKQNGTPYEDMKSPTSVGKSSTGTAYEQMTRSSSNDKKTYRTASNYSIISSTSYDNLTPASIRNEDELSSEGELANIPVQIPEEDYPEYSKVCKPDRNPDRAFATTGEVDDDSDYTMVHDPYMRSPTPITAV